MKANLQAGSSGQVPAPPEKRFLSVGLLWDDVGDIMYLFGASGD